jgi:replicative DNA helicase
MELKAAARELGEICKGTLIAVSQLSRIPPGERPQLHHLRESGQIEQDADTVLLLSDQGNVELGQTLPWTKILDVAKQRNGPTGLVRFTFFPGVMGFEQPAAWRKEPG